MIVGKFLLGRRLAVIRPFFVHDLFEEWSLASLRAVASCRCAVVQAFKVFLLHGENHFLSTSLPSSYGALSSSTGRYFDVLVNSRGGRIQHCVIYLARTASISNGEGSLHQGTFISFSGYSWYTSTLLLAELISSTNEEWWSQVHHLLQIEWKRYLKIIKHLDARLCCCMIGADIR